MGSGGSKNKRPTNTNQSAGGIKAKGEATPSSTAKGETTLPPTAKGEATLPPTAKGEATPSSTTKEENSGVKLPPINKDAPVTSSLPPVNTAGGQSGKDNSNIKAGNSTLPALAETPVQEKQEKTESKSTKGDNPPGVGNPSPTGGNVPKDTTNSISEKKVVDTETGSKDGVAEVVDTESKATENAETSAANTEEMDVIKKPEIEERVIPPQPEDQRKFDDALSSACLLIKPDSLLKKLNIENVTKLQLQRALPSTFKLHDLLTKLTHVQELDLSNNNMGPQSFRSVCLAMCTNSTILSLNLADNKTDTDSAECLGRMLRMNQTLVYLNVSSNNLGIDYFSKCVGPTLKTNTTLQTFRAQSVGARDMRSVMEGLKENSSLVELDFSVNSFRDPANVAQGLADILKRPDCCLRTLSLGSCEMTEASIETLRQGLQENFSMAELNLNGNTFGSLKTLMKVVVTAATHPCINTLSVDNAQVQDKACSHQDAASCVRSGVTPELQFLSLSSSKIDDNFLSSLATLLKGKQLQLPLIDLDLGANDDLTSGCLQSVSDMTSADGCPSLLRKLKYNLIKNTDGLTAQLTSGQFPSLRYLNVRKSKLTNAHLLPDLYKGQGHLTTLILDGQKIANTDVLGVLLESSPGGSLTTLSIGGCSLAATDVVPLCQAIRNGLKLQMLKVSSNRLESKGVIELVEAVLSNNTHPLAVLDVSDNTMTDDGAVALAKLFTAKDHESELHSLNVSSNDLGKAGVMSLVSVIGGKSPLRTLYLQNQTKALQEGEMEEIFETLAKSLGFKVEMKGGEIVCGCSDLPTLPDGLVVKLSPLGGSPGTLGCHMDSPRILTDYAEEKLPYLSFADIQVLSAFLKGSGSDVCVWSSDEWKMIIGANKPTTDAPSWLQVAASRDVVVYLCNLPGNTTRQKVEALLEMEADCNLDEVCLMKDPVTRSINGVGWVLLGDQESVTKAINFFHSGLAMIFGQAFLISPIKVKVDDEANAESESQARDDQVKRLKQRRQDDRDHDRLIQRTTEESWKRHAYRLAHPAYADGRIW